jgi:4-hydroxy-tetrahydrodipicolinate synthase
VFPSNEATLMDARNGGPFAGCISATANLNAWECAKAYRDGDAAALARAVTVRKLFEGLPLIAGVKCVLAHAHGDPALEAVMPPLSPVPDPAALKSRYEAVK